MTQEQWSKIVSIILTAIIAIAAVFGYNFIVVQPQFADVQAQLAPPTVDAQLQDLAGSRAAGIDREFESIFIDKALTNAGTLTQSGAATFAGASAFNGATTLAGNVTLGAKLIDSSTAITLTAGQVITPAYGFYDISSSGAVSMTLAACTSAAKGQRLLLYGNDANTVTVNDSNIRTTDGNAVTFGQYDVVGFVCSGAEWDHMFKSANQ